MERYCVSCKKDTIDRKTKKMIRKTKQDRLVIISECAFCAKKNLDLLKSKKLVDYWAI